jgi:hypothetical protein
MKCHQDQIPIKVGEEDTYTVLGSGDKLVSYVNDSEPNNKIESRIVDFIKEFEEIKPPVKKNLNLEFTKILNLISISLFCTC